MKIKGTVVSASFDLVKSNGLNVFAMVFLTLDGAVLIDTAVAGYNGITMQEVTRVGDEKNMFGKKIIVKGNL